MIDLDDRVPLPLRALAELAYDTWWSWQRGGAELFRDVDPERWEACGKNPVKLLRDASPARLAAAAADATLVARATAMHAAWKAARERPLERVDVTPAHRPIAYLCAEFGIDAALPIYSGGLGVLAGDMLKEASDLGVPMVGVGLFYRRGYFRQRLDLSGHQHEYWTTANPEELPMTREVDERGAPRVVHVRLRGRPVAARIWRVQVGRVPLLLLDTDLPENDATSRWITSTLYVSDRAMRLMQYAVLAIGGVRALRLLGIEPGLFHLNEGHASLAALELLRERLAAHVPFERALDEVRSRVVFTTHTPVAAGNERYHASEVAAVLGSFAEEVGITDEQLFALARGRPEDDQQLGVTELAIHTSRSTNGVSARHGETARGMWQHLWPGRDARDVPITHVTNGVHAPTWMAPPMRDLVDKHAGPGWDTSSDAARLEAILAMPDEEVWAARRALRARLVEYVRTKSVTDRLARGEPISYAEGASSTFDPDVLTIGFARRVASYKRLGLLVRDPARALGFLRGGRVQVVIAGRAHPADEGAKSIVEAIFNLKNIEGAGSRVAFIEDYDLAVAHELVAGCDVWVNLPRVPLEASGTSGMKAALNGGLNVSVLDGWWCEAFSDGLTGWGIASSNEADEATQDARDAETLFGILERDVVPTFYDRDASGIPRAWLRRVKGSLHRIATSFTARRMVEDYATRVWRSGGGSER